MPKKSRRSLKRMQNQGIILINGSYRARLWCAKKTNDILYRRKVTIVQAHETKKHYCDKTEYTTLLSRVAVKA